MHCGWNTNITKSTLEGRGAPRGWFTLSELKSDQMWMINVCCCSQSPTRRNWKWSVLPGDNTQECNTTIWCVSIKETHKRAPGHKVFLNIITVYLNAHHAREETCCSRVSSLSWEIQPLQHSTHTLQNIYGSTYRIFSRLYWSLCFYTLRLAAAVLSSMAPRQSITPQYCRVWGCRQQQLA